MIPALRYAGAYADAQRTQLGGGHARHRRLPFERPSLDGRRRHAHMLPTKILASLAFAMIGHTAASRRSADRDNNMMPFTYLPYRALMSARRAGRVIKQLDTPEAPFRQEYFSRIILYDYYWAMGAIFTPCHRDIISSPFPHAASGRGRRRALPRIGYAQARLIGHAILRTLMTIVAVATMLLPPAMIRWRSKKPR